MEKGCNFTVALILGTVMALMASSTDAKASASGILLKLRKAKSICTGGAVVESLGAAGA
jgi:hypothetical protein